MISQKTIDTVLDTASIVDVVSDYVKLSKSGINWKGCCPFHGEKRPSFFVSPAKNICKCFSCGKGGNPIGFLMEQEAISYPEAVKRLADKYSITVIEDNAELSEEEKEIRDKRESMFIINEAANEFFVEQLHKPENVAALHYANTRWNGRRESKNREYNDEDKDYVNIQSIGFAPDGWDNLINWAKGKGYNLKYMEESGLITVSKKGNYIDVFRNRITIPIKDKYGRITGWTARLMDEDSDAPKYINPKDSIIFEKSAILFGIDIARKRMLNEQKVYLVEGAPDAMKLQSIGIENTVAALGTALTETHLNILKNIFRSTEATLCFIPDSDTKPGQKEGPGIKAVLKNGAAAMKHGFRVTVKEIPTEDGIKQDADSYITSQSVLDNLEEKDFLCWYASKKIDISANTSELFQQIKKVCSLALCIKKDLMREAIIDTLAPDYGGKGLWKQAMKAAQQEEDRRKAELAAKNSEVDTSKYGFYEENNCIYSGKQKQWSNFIMRPLFHIKDPYNSKRLYMIRNFANEEVLVEMKEAEMNSLQNFRERVGSMGNFRWKVGPQELNTLGDYLYDNTETAVEIKQLGWNPAGFFVWGNGIVNDGKFTKVDDYGICRVDRVNEKGKTEIQNYYLPAMSKIYADRKDLFKFERMFVHSEDHSSITLPRYAQIMADVFGNNAIIGLSFMMATLFRNIVTSYTKNFPILNLFGPKGSGKSELGHTLMSFFIRNNTPMNIQNATIAALADAIAQCSNALVHVDEYKNNVDPVKVEFLKGLYDGAGRSRMNMELDKKREITSVDSGVILSGQEMPTVDIALFSRTIFLTFENTVHSTDAKRKFNELANIRKMGVSHLTNDILSHYAEFESKFYDTYNWVSEDIAEEVQKNEVEDRIWRDWAVMLATYRCLYRSLELPWDYNDVRKIVIDGIERQNQECAASNELGAFWDMFENMVSSGIIFNEGDYKIKECRGLKTNIFNREFPDKKRVLMMDPKNIIRLYKIEAKKTGEKVMSESSIKFYLKTSPGYLGQKDGSERFKVIVNGVIQRELKSSNDGGKLVDLVKFRNPLCFDYTTLQKKFNLNLDMKATDAITDEDLQSEYDKPAPEEQNIPFA